MGNPKEIPSELVSKVSDAFFNIKTGEVFLANYIGTTLKTTYIIPKPVSNQANEFNNRSAC